MTIVSIREVKTHLSALLSIVAREGERIIICRHGRAVAELGPVSRKSRVRTDPFLKKIKILGDITEPSVREWESIRN
jgi:antitoxin (DNA-binding transcriptional repressor) of toxin-antitoxin stability system